MRLLVLGGTKFLGRGVVDAALASDHEVTLFNRGQTNADLYPEVDHPRVGAGLDALAGRSWDAVIDTSGYVPRVVRQSAALLRDKVTRYVFVSSISVYADASEPITEATPVAELEDPATEEVMEHYGALKAACERVVEEIYGDRARSCRMIVGPYDPTDRFTYWPRRIGGGDARAWRPCRPGATRRRATSARGSSSSRSKARRCLQCNGACGAARVRRATRTRTRSDRVGGELRVGGLPEDPGRGRSAVDGAAALAARSGLRGDDAGRRAAGP
jgi:hypothetical protein